MAVMSIHVVSHALDYAGSGEYLCGELYCPYGSGEYLCRKSYPGLCNQW